MIFFKQKISKLKYLLLIIFFIQAAWCTEKDTSCKDKSCKDTSCKDKSCKDTSFLKLSSNDIQMTLKGLLQEDYFFYKHVRTLSDKFYDQNDFFRHKLCLDFSIKQGEKKFGKPSSHAGVKLTNYVVWQQNDYYMPFSRDPLRSQDLNSVITVNQYDTKTLLPLIFLEEAWLQINFDTFARAFNKNPTFLKAGFFLYEVGRGLSLGYHNDLSVEYMGWPGVSNFTRYPQMPPGILLSTQILDSLSGDIYFMKWREVDANLEDVMYPSRAQRLGTERMERGTNKDRYNLAVKFDYTPEERNYGKVLLEPYWVYTHAPELSVEFDSDSKAYLHTLGMMFDYNYGNFEVNCEIAGQFGDQTMFAIDRNIKSLSLGNDGSTSEVFSHIFQQNNVSRNQATVSIKDGGSGPTQTSYTPQDSLLYVVNLPQNRRLDAQGQQIKDVQMKGQPPVYIYNSNLFGNARFRKEYKLEHQGVMALFDMAYNFKKQHLKLAGALGYISGDEYPFNDENSKTYHGFIPMRSRYKGLSVKNTLIFDRLVLPRPLNIDYRTMYAHDNLKDLANLQFVGAGLTWYPFKKKEKCSLNSDLMFFWESGHLYKWDKNGHYPDPSIENQIAFDRAFLGFPGVTPQYKDQAQDPTNKGWLSNKSASRFLGTELDLRAEYNPIKDCVFSGQTCLFFPGNLFKDLQGQPNILTQYVDNLGLSHYDSLGDKFAFSFIIGIDYKF